MAGSGDSPRSGRERLRVAGLAAGAAALLAGPFVLAFFSGGFFDRPRIVAAIAAWVLVALAAIAAPRPLPRGRAGLAAMAGLGLLAGWTALSFAWAPVVDAAHDDLQRVLLYAGALVAGAALLRGRARRAVEPAVLAGTVVLVVYGMSDRLLPRVVRIDHYFSAGSRLEQPLTYWNAMGLVAAIGLVLAARLAADRSRPPAVRVLAAAAGAPLGAGLYLTFSRGAIAALGVGLVVLLAAAPTWPQLRAAVLVLEAGAVTALTASLMPGVVNFDTTEAARQWQGDVFLAVVGLAAVAAGCLQAWACRSERAGVARLDRLPLPRRSGAVAAGLIVLAAAGFVAAAAREPRSSAPPTGAATQRLGSLQSNRYEYWQVATGAFADHPVAGTGAGGFRVEWLRRRTITEQAKDAHSLYLETAAELGLIGLAALALALGGVALAARDAMRRAPAAATGALAVVVMWAFRAGIDWDWEMPAVTLLAVLFAAVLIALAETPPGVSRASPPD